MDVIDCMASFETAVMPFLFFNNTYITENSPVLYQR